MICYNMLSHRPDPRDPGRWRHGRGGAAARPGPLRQGQEQDAEGELPNLASKWSSTTLRCGRVDAGSVRFSARVSTTSVPGKRSSPRRLQSAPRTKKKHPRHRSSRNPARRIPRSGRQGQAGSTSSSSRSRRRTPARSSTEPLPKGLRRRKDKPHSIR